ncbi:TPA: Fe-S cluster assembly ATPase SufC [Patescibacteria group bacterium]|nr:MAG: FeS assembly ATPase SufC [Parcubacteria group bacterium GW2011_GWD2_42_14]HCC05103.1 Fe-S cluster assembly ATPase SufC [Patescibacteria group bacterium]
MLEIKNICIEISSDPVSKEESRKNVVRDTSLSIESGSVSVLMGPNGSGKSTLVNALLGHPNYRVSSGSLVLDGVDITDLSTEKKAQQGIFLSMQNVPKIGGLTLAMFLHKAYTATHETDVSVLEFYITLRDKAEALSIKTELLDRPLTAGLSGGEKKLSEVLQLAALQPKFAILDEIDSGVDVDALRTVFKAIDALKKEGTGFLVISHHPSLLDHLAPEHVYVMSAGSMVRQGGRELAEEIIKNGFCNVAKCRHVDTCMGRCS